MKKVKADGWKSYQAHTNGLERDYVGEIIQSRGHWRLAALGLGGIAACSVAAVMGLTPLKSVKVVPIRVDTITGHVEVASPLSDHTPTQGEAVDKHWLTQYVIHRETYDYNTIQYDYNTVALLSTPSVQGDYFKIFAGKEGRDKQLQNVYRISTNIKSVTLNKGTGTAVVRYWTEKRLTSGAAQPPERQDFIATIAYEYVDAPMKESDRLTNPLGFQVTAFRVDPETVGVQ